MKYLFSMLLISSAMFVSAQSLIIDRIDEFDGDTVKVTKDYVVGKAAVSKLYCSVRRINSYYGISFWSTADQGCAGSGKNYVILMNAEGDKITLTEDIADIKCNNTAESLYVADPTDFVGFVVTRIRFAQSEGYLDFTVSGDYTIEQLFNTLK